MCTPPTVLVIGTWGDTCKDPRYHKERNRTRWTVGLRGVGRDKLHQTTLTMEEPCNPASMWVLRAVHLLECDLIFMQSVKVALDEHEYSTRLDAFRYFEHRNMVRTNL